MTWKKTNEQTTRADNTTRESSSQNFFDCCCLGLFEDFLMEMCERRKLLTGGPDIKKTWGDQPAFQETHLLSISIQEHSLEHFLEPPFFLPISILSGTQPLQICRAPISCQCSMLSRTQQMSFSLVNKGAILRESGFGSNRCRQQFC